MQKLLELKIISEINKDYIMQHGEIIRRIGDGKDQQGCFMRYDDKNNPILVNVIDMADCEFAAEAGILKIKKNDLLYKFEKTFANSSKSAEAKSILYNWPLYKKNPDLNNAMLNFMAASYSPEQIIDFKKTDNLKFVFIPIQQKFKIGRFEEKVNWALVRKQRFFDNLDQIHPGDHITYIAFIPPTNSHNPLFYSLGTKPHETTHESLKTEPFMFEPTHGGHIKLIDDKNGKKTFLVDAGSNYIGKGNKTSMAIAKDITKALGAMFPDYVFRPIEGRGAFGTGQSY